MRNSIIKLTVSIAGAAGWLTFAAGPVRAQYHQFSLTGYQPGMGRFLDRKLNGWGMDSASDGSFCVANTSPGVATFYNQSGKPLPLVINIPAAPSHAFGPLGTPTGLVYNPTAEFVISKDGRSAPAVFIFNSLDGTISGWNPSVDPDNAITILDNSGAGALYTGLALGQDSQGRNVLYAANWGQNRVDMLGGTFNSLGSFTDPNVPAQLASHHVFGVENESGKLYVTFGALSPPFGGVVDVFDVDGNLLTPDHFAVNAPGAGPLVNPWAITRAPAHFGRFSNRLLIGNVEDGKINAFNPDTGAFLGPLTDSNKNAIVIPGLWELTFGNPRRNGRPNQLFFNAGPNAPDFAGNGLFGVILATGAQGDRD